MTVQHEVTTKKYNRNCLTGFILGFASIFLAFIGMIPILALVFSIIGLSKFNPEVNKGRWQGIVGLLLGILYTLVYLNNYGHI
ncbi:hypothetical protein V2151_26565 [Bacillus cereus]|uniref:hypothetical protein n=1 Tax=Bacillus cereus TaxID=1396 RepID=UPI002ED7B798